MMQRRPREKDNKHLDFIRGLPCLLCNDPTSTEAAHVRYADPMVAKPISGMGNKSDDAYTVPLCGKHHREQTNYGDERGWWARLGVDPVKVALALHRFSGDQEIGERISDFISGIVTRFAYADH
jgi:hypothetical protein